MDVTALITKAVELHVAGDLDGAAVAYRDTLAAVPGHAHALINLGAIAHEKGEFEAALRLYELAIAADPDNASAHSNLGVSLGAVHRYEEAAAAYSRALAIDPDYVMALNNLGDGLVNLGRYDEAAATLQRFLEFQPDFAKAYCNLGRAYWGQGRNDAAIAALNVAIALDPKAPLPRKNRAMVLLMCGRFAEGWPEYEFRFAADGTPPRPFTMPYWNGLPLVWGKLLVWAEHGPGDEIWQASMAADLKGRGVDEVVWECSARLVNLFQRSMPQITFVARAEPPAELAKACDMQVPAAALGRALRRSAESFPADRRSFLVADPERAAEIRVRLGLAPGEKLVGVSWCSKNLSYGAKKSTQLADWRELLKTPGCRFVDLQYGDTAEDRAGVEGLIHLEDLDLMDDIDGLAALISLCDVVITVSNTTAHLAGALGVPTWILVDAGGGRLWHWGDESVTTPWWYPSATIIRRSKGEPWSAAIAAAAAKLNTFLQTEA